MDWQQIRIDGERLRRTWAEMAAIGATPAGGVTRLTLTDEDKRARDLFVDWCTELGAHVQVDDVGNVAAIRRGVDERALPVVIGSHLDSVATGGRFDGTLGVLAGLEVLRRLEDLGVRTRRPVAVVDFTNEEGVRFEPAMACSGVLAEAFTAAQVHDFRDRDGRRFGDELARIGYLGTAEERLDRIHAYFELHIEQGPVLEAEGCPVGVVEGILSIAWMDLAFSGDQNHAGSTPMDMRRDPMQAAARFIVEFRDLVRQHPGARTTVGRLQAEPGLFNVIPGRVRMSTDLRHRDDALVDRLVDEAREMAGRIAREEGVELAFDPFWRSPATLFDPGLRELLAREARRLGIPHLRLMSGPGHDAKYMADITRAAMIFVRTRGGKSHCEEESAEWDDCVLATDLLLQAVLDQAGVADA